MPFHYAKIDKSLRLQTLRDFLRSRGNQGATGAEIWEACRMLNPATYCSELNANGLEVETRYEGISANRRKVYRYILIEKEQGELRL